MKLCSKCNAEMPVKARNDTCRRCLQPMYQKRCEERKRARGVFTFERKAQKLKREYGISYDQFRAMLDEQHNCCAICQNEFPEERNAHIDHCHEKQFVRGLLCNLCNVGLGSFRDSPALLRMAIDYLAQEPVEIREETIDDLVSSITFN